jgi:hypothetical protein
LKGGTPPDIASLARNPAQRWQAGRKEILWRGSTGV